MKSQGQQKDFNNKQRRICKSKSYKIEHNVNFFLESHKVSPSNPINFQLSSNKSPIKRLSSKPTQDGLGQSGRSFTSLSKKSTTLLKVLRRWSFYELMSEKQRRLNKKAPKTIVKFISLMAAKTKKKKMHRMRMQYKFLGKMNKNKIRKMRSKTLPLPIILKMKHTRAKTVVEDFYQGPIFCLDEDLNRKIAQLIMLKKAAKKRHTCFQLPKKSVFVSKERLLKFQQQLKEKLVQYSDSESNIAGSPYLDSTKAYQRKIHFEQKKKQIKAMSQKNTNQIKALLKKPSNNVINSYISIKTKTQNSLHNSCRALPLADFASKLGDRLTTLQSSQEYPTQRRRPNLLVKLQPYLTRQK